MQPSDAQSDRRLAESRMPAMQSDYNKQSGNQARALQLFKPFMSAAVAAHAADLAQLAQSGAAFVIADFGCSTGLNSSDAVSHLVRQLRGRYGSGSPGCSSVLVVLNDLPRNHWTELFGFLHNDQRSILHQLPDVFAVTSGQSFYEQVLPPSSLQIGISNICLHWCSKLPTKLASHCFALFGSDEEREAFRRQAAEDWRRFLEARAKELVKGGVLALNFLSSQDKSISIFDELYKAAEALLARGVIEPEELSNFNCHVCFRSLEDVSDLSLYESLGLELLRAEKLPQNRSTYYEDFLQHGDAERFAAEYSGSCRVTIESSFLNGLSSARSESDRATICAELWREHRARVAQQPRLFEFTWTTLGIVLRKI